jgi:hypothetical protein
LIFESNIIYTLHDEKTICFLAYLPYFETQNMNIISPPKDLLKDLADSYETWYEYHASRCHIGVVTLNFLLSQYHIFHNITSEFRMVIIRIIFII